MLLLLAGLAQLLGWLAVTLKQPKVIGEIAAGILLGNVLSGRHLAFAHLLESTKHQSNVLDFVYWLGLLLLMFMAGTEAKHFFTREERRELGLLIALGTGIPFLLGLLFAPWLIRPSLMGPNGNSFSLSIILGVGVAVTSVPVVSKIFADFKILHTRFARLVLGVAVVEDIVLWMALAVAIAAAGKTALDQHALWRHVAFTAIFFAAGLTVVPRVIKRLNHGSFNVVLRSSPTGYALSLLLGYCVVAGALNVSMVFAAFLAGFAVLRGGPELSHEAKDALGTVAYAFFVPVYFSIVGYRLDFARGFSLSMILVFLLGTSAVKFVSVALAGRVAGFRGLDLVNLALTTNARGGPGIVLASVTFDAGIISPKFYTTLVLAAVLTSQLAGAWLGLVLRKGWPLLKTAAPDSSALSSEVVR